MSVITKLGLFSTPGLVWVSDSLYKVRGENFWENLFHNVEYIFTIFTVPGVGLTPTDAPDKDHVARALSAARKSTASVGKFTDQLPKEKPAKRVGKKRKVGPTASIRRWPYCCFSITLSVRNYLFTACSLHCNLPHLLVVCSLNLIRVTCVMRRRNQWTFSAKYSVAFRLWTSLRRPINTWHKKTRTGSPDNAIGQMQR